MPIPTTASFEDLLELIGSKKQDFIRDIPFKWINYLKNEFERDVAASKGNKTPFYEFVQSKMGVLQKAVKSLWFLPRDMVARLIDNDLQPVWSSEESGSAMYKALMPSLSVRDKVFYLDLSYVEFVPVIGNSSQFRREAKVRVYSVGCSIDNPNSIYFPLGIPSWRLSSVMFVPENITPNAKTKTKTFNAYDSVRRCTDGGPWSKLKLVYSDVPAVNGVKKLSSGLPPSCFSAFFSDSTPYLIDLNDNHDDHSPLEGFVNGHELLQPKT